MSCFCTSAAIEHKGFNIFTEAVGTMVLVFAALSIPQPAQTLGAINALPVALVVLGIGLSLGGPTGYAINPARDFGPRLVYSLLPFTTKVPQHWRYAWVPIVGPIIGGIIGAILYHYLQQ
jgi:glycerol uptake facilitator protein